MSEMALRSAAAGPWRRFAGARQVLVGIADGFAAARRHGRLAAMSNAELARREFTREDLRWFAAYGERRPR